MRVAVTGASGQDGMILTRRLAARGHSVLALCSPRSESQVRATLGDNPLIDIAPAELTEAERLKSTVASWQPERIFHLGGISSIAEAERDPAYTQAVNVTSVECLLELIAHKGMRDCRFLLASSGAVFEQARECPQSEGTPVAPRTRYAKSKAAAMEIVRKARSEWGLFACSAIMYNHESPLRGDQFVTRIVSKSVARIHAGLDTRLRINTLEVSRDWGWAPDYITALEKMAAMSRPVDLVLGTGRKSTLTEFVAAAFATVGISNWEVLVDTGSEDTRPANPTHLCGDSALAMGHLGWTHTKSLQEIAQEMVLFDLRLLSEPDCVWSEACPP